MLVEKIFSNDQAGSSDEHRRPNSTSNSKSFGSSSHEAADEPNYDPPSYFQFETPHLDEGSSSQSRTLEVIDQDQVIEDRVVKDRVIEHQVVKDQVELDVASSYLPESVYQPTIVAVPRGVNNLFVHNRSEPILGTYIIDPGLELTDSQGKKKKKKSKHGSLNASFSSRKDECQLNLGIASEDGVPRKANVEISSKTHISVNLLPSPSDGRIQLFAKCTQGNITLMIPRSYRGGIQASTGNKNKLTFLPELSQDMRIAITKPKETIVFVGGHPSTFAPPGAGTIGLQKYQQETLLDDFCQLYSKKGTIFIGYVGEQLPERPKGFFQRLRQRKSQACIS